jgi:hypothetical protein
MPAILILLKIRFVHKLNQTSIVSGQHYLKDNSLSAFKNRRGLRLIKKAGIFTNIADYNVTLGMGFTERTTHGVNVIVETIIGGIKHCRSPYSNS